MCNLANDGNQLTLGCGEGHVAHVRRLVAAVKWVRLVLIIIEFQRVRVVAAACSPETVQLSVADESSSEKISN